MFYKAWLIALLSLGAISTVSAQTYWLNMVVDGDSISLATFSDEKCSEAVIRYVRSNLVNFVSCDVQPLPDAVNTGR